MEEEEGLDEREPEKAICADRYRILAANGHQMIEEFKHQVIEMKQNEAPRNKTTGGDVNTEDTNAAGAGDSNKKNKRKKKKRQKAKQIKQEQKLLFQKGIAIDDTADDDIYAMLVPGESDQQNSTSNSK